MLFIAQKMALQFYIHFGSTEQSKQTIKHTAHTVALPHQCRTSNQCDQSSGVTFELSECKRGALKQRFQGKLKTLEGKLKTVDQKCREQKKKLRQVTREAKDAERLRVEVANMLEENGITT